jgi:hypothetical protein
MARSISDIFNAVVTEKQTLANLDALLEGSVSTATSPFKRLLNDVSSSSKVASWRLWVFVISVAIWVHEKLWDVFKEEIEELALQAISGNTYWYLRQVFSFQYGHDLALINNKFQYAVIDEDARIITRAAIVDANGELRIKIAKNNDLGNPTPLDNAEKNAFTAYMNKIKFAGTKLLIINDNADSLRFDLELYYNPLLGYENVKTNVENAIKTHLANLEFNGALNIVKFTDSIQLAAGVTDLVIRSIEARYGALEFKPIKRQYVPNSGYLTVIGGLPLNNSVILDNGSVDTSNDSNVKITYIPNV